MTIGQSVMVTEEIPMLLDESTHRGNFKYESLARELESQIKSGTYAPGQRLPSIRELHKQLGLSISTVNQAFISLEQSGLVEVRPKSGYFVSEVKHTRFESPQHRQFRSIPKKVSLQKIDNQILSSLNAPGVTSVGCALLGEELLPTRHFAKALKSFSTKEIGRCLNYGSVQGEYRLRQHVAQLMAGTLHDIDPEDLIITNGCVEALLITLLTVAQPGELVAVESPTFFMTLKLLEELGIRVVEIPTTPQHGIDVEAFERIAKTLDVRACLLIPNFNNPLGSLLPDDKKQKLVKVATELDIPLIEDGVYSELYYGASRPSFLKTFDQRDQVFTCSSFSKTISPGLRVGWLLPPKRYYDKAVRLKGCFSLSTPILNQQLLCEFIENGAYNRHLMKLRTQLKQQVNQTIHAIDQYFPKNTRLVPPQGGFILWVELDEGINSLDIYNTAIENQIAIVPGIICAAGKRFQNFIRLSCGSPFTPRIDKAIQRLGEILKEATK